MGVGMSYSWGVGPSSSASGDGSCSAQPRGVIAPIGHARPARAGGEGSGRPESAGDPPVNIELRRLAAELAPMVDVWQRLLEEHTADPAGRCRTCTKGGTGLPTTRWPCSIHGIADLARRCYHTKTA